MELRPGMKGTAVKQMQDNLYTAGYLGYYDIGGVFDGNTENALRSFQYDSGLNPDGVYGILSQVAVQSFNGIVPIARSSISVLADESGEYTTYTVKEGDWLIKIAKMYGCTWSEIYNLNRDKISNPNLIYPGQVLKIPIKETPKPSTPSVVSKPSTSSGSSVPSYSSEGWDNYNLITIANTTFNPPRYISFYGMVPDELTEGHNTEYEAVSIKSRSSPIPVYGGSSARSVELTIDVHEDYLRRFGNGEPSLLDYMNRVRAFTYPSYSSGAVIPPRLFVKIGDFIEMNCTCNSSNISWRKPYRKDKNGRWVAISASISLSLSSYDRIPLSAEGVYGGQQYG